MSLTSDQIEALLGGQGHAQYGGEAVSQLEHALQCAWLAEQAGDDDALVVASLLHDLGHLLFNQGEDDLAQGKDDLHQHKVLPFLRHALPAEVVEPIGLHVEAKRYLCHSLDGYFEALSEASKQSLALQGGPLTAAAADAFLALPHATRAVRLRRHDDAAKIPGLPTPSLDHFMPRVRAMMASTK